MEDSYFENPLHRQHQSQNPNSGCLRFRSAPTSLLSTLKDSLDKGYYNCNQFPIFGGGGCDDSFESAEIKPFRIPRNGYSDTVSQMVGQQSRLPSEYPNQSVNSQLPSGGMEVGSSAGVDGPNLGRQISSPSVFFAHLNSQNRYNITRGIESSRMGSGTCEEYCPTTRWLKGQIDFAFGLSSSMPLVPRIPKMVTEFDDAASHDAVKLKNGRVDGRFYSRGLSFTSWNDPARLVQNTPGPRTDQQNDRGSYSCSDASIARACGKLENQNHLLSCHLSLPKTSAEMAAMEKFQFQDNVPCKIRARRGCATHPRSIAERVRRTRISERMKKLQDLVPNMEKQINTADMLDLVAKYIKDLQQEYKVLSANRALCKCLEGQESTVNQAV
ncbi:hypothetical protein Nepgr_016324 [Nepenthes gracilis]|uniref:BHLH domain-containing protein n=1 Tax=Nepenthes gracilis TaxID=150966 RepID=A0AAD3SNC1_NEPGR|nr:hypothetical protein Nepgr_016324 [Nepenthes gracilis]